MGGFVCSGISFFQGVSFRFWNTGFLKVDFPDTNHDIDNDVLTTCCCSEDCAMNIYNGSLKMRCNPGVQNESILLVHTVHLISICRNVICVLNTPVLNPPSIELSTLFLIHCCGFEITSLGSCEHLTF